MGGGHVFAARPAAVLPVADEAPSGQSGGDKPRHGGIRCRSVLRLRPGCNSLRAVAERDKWAKRAGGLASGLRDGSAYPLSPERDKFGKAHCAVAPLVP